jgi:acyl dehydratase/NAD(P)-dependent dehydrogenase (short-subunit alcohol dehydrogenase family)
LRAHVRTRVFTDADQARFAGLSGDRNPIHLDPLAARRTQAGAPVVHGVHAVLWSLETLIADGRIAAPIASLGVQFLKFVYTDTEVALFAVRETPAALRAELVADGVTAVRIDVAYGSNDDAEAPALSTRDAAVHATPRACDFAELRACAGVLGALPADRAAAMFPAVAARLGAPRTAAVVQLSTLVGMVCPGLHSIFGGFTVRAVAISPQSERLSFSVSGADERVRMLILAVAGGGVAGELTAFVRRAPAPARGLAEIAQHVRPGEFASTTALVVGGSRGLGAATARALAAGGGRVVVTYRVGEAEARELAAEIGPERCRAVRYDARAGAPEQLAGLDWDVTQLYYFATPHIFRQKAGWWEPDRFTELCEVYVNGFARICAALRERPGELIAFYPSSVAVDERPRDMAEYGAAKAAGEMLCADMNRFARGVRVVVKRLPRTDTDQTATLVGAPSADPLDVMLPVVRELHALERRPQAISR